MGERGISSGSGSGSGRVRKWESVEYGCITKRGSAVVEKESYKCRHYCPAVAPAVGGEIRIRRISVKYSNMKYSSMKYYCEVS